MGAANSGFEVLRHLRIQMADETVGQLQRLRQVLQERFFRPGDRDRWGQTVDDRVPQDPAAVARAITDYALGGHTASRCIANRTFRSWRWTFEHEALGGRLLRVAGGGLQRSVRKWAPRQGWGGRPVRQEQAQGILVAGLGVLAAHVGDGEVRRAS